MGVPFEALIPYGIMLAMFGFSGAAISKLRHMQNGGKRGRHSLDAWDRQKAIDEDGKATPTTWVDGRALGRLMERDMRLTGWLRGQTDNAVAPAGFEFSNGWKLEKRIT
ncbi:hypothetical protein MBLNU457_6760t1 [Dothideomycetes sp. NU457]